MALHSTLRHHQSPCQYSAAMRPPSPAQGVGKPGLISRHGSTRELERHYEEVRELGRGSFGRVALVRERATGRERVCKTVDIAGMQPFIVSLMKTEIELLRALDHPGVVRLYEYAEDVERQQLVLIMEYMPGGGCDGLLAAGRSPPSEALVARLVSQLLATLEYCHAQGVVHRDVKPENMMLTRATSLWGSPDCKLIDFGLAGRTGPDGKLSGKVGTPPYMAPEVVRQEAHTCKADLWSVGATAFELLSGRAPFSRDHERAYEGIKQYRSFDELQARFDGEARWFGRRSQESRDFLRQLLHPDPNKRPTALEALDHPWLQQHMPPAPQLTTEIARSLAGYASAPAFARSCLLVVAARLGTADLEALGAAFLGADVDGDGKLSREELTEALGTVSSGWWWDPAVEVDVASVFEAADLDRSGLLGYTEFVAACTYARHGSTEELVRKAFHALDADRDGRIAVRDLRGAFGERDAELLRTLPQDRQFGIAEWCACVEAFERKARKQARAKRSGHRRVVTCHI